MSPTQTNPVIQFISFAEAAQRLEISHAELMLLVERAAIKGYRYGKEIYLDLGEVEALRQGQPAA